jgi:hypothetical protein
VRMGDGIELIVSCLPCPVAPEDDEKARANVRLVRAAPELLRVVREFLRQSAVQHATYNIDIGLSTAADHANNVVRKVEGGHD